VTRSDAYAAVKKISGELAAATMSYLPSDTPMGTASFSSDMIIASVRSLPGKRFSDTYARSYLSYKDRVETEYMDSYLQSSFQLRVFAEAGQTFLHWSIEPETMNFGTQGDAIYAAFELVLRLEDSRGYSRIREDRGDPLKLTAEQFRAHARRRFAFQDLLAVILASIERCSSSRTRRPGDFSSVETRIVVPGPRRESGPR